MAPTNTSNFAESFLTEDVGVAMKLSRIEGIFFLWIVILSSSSGCALRTRLMVDLSSPVINQMNASFNQNCDIGIMRDGMPFALTTISGLIDISPNNRDFLLNGSNAYFGYAFAFVEETDTDRAGKFYLKARNYGFRAIFKNEYEEILSKPLDEFKVYVKKLKKKDVPAMFWGTISWLSYIRLNLSDIEVLLDIPKAEALARRLIELDETYLFGSPHVIMASYYSAQPEITGGNPEKAKAHFEKALLIAESKFLMHQLYFAKYYAVRIQDRELFVKLLTSITEVPEDILPSHCVVTNLSKMKAKKLLDNVDDFF